MEAAEKVGPGESSHAASLQSSNSRRPEVSGPKEGHGDNQDDVFQLDEVSHGLGSEIPRPSCSSELGHVISFM